MMKHLLWYLDPQSKFYPLLPIIPFITLTVDIYFTFTQGKAPKHLLWEKPLKRQDM